MEEDALSLRDLPILEDGEESLPKSPYASSPHHRFEFHSSSCLSSQHPFFDGDSNNEDELNEYQKRDYLSLRSSSSFHNPSSFSLIDDSDSRLGSARSRSISGRLFGSEAYSPAATVKSSSSCSAPKVNITALTSMSAKWRRRMFMFGPVKFKPEMELSAIRERQGRRSPSPMFRLTEDEESVDLAGSGCVKSYMRLAVAGGGAAMVKGSGGGDPVGCRGNIPWKLLRTWRRRSHLAALLSKSFRCVSPSVV